MFEEKRHIKRPRKRSASRTALFDPLALEKQCDNPVTASILAGITAPLVPSSATAVAAIRAYFDLMLKRLPSEPVAQTDVPDEGLLFPMDDLPVSSDSRLDVPDEELLLDVSDEDLLFPMDDLFDGSGPFCSADLPSTQSTGRPRRRSPNTSISSAEFTYSSDADEDIDVDISSDEKSREVRSDHTASVLSAYYVLVSRWRVALQDPERGGSSQEDLILLSQLIDHALLLFRFVHRDITKNLVFDPQVMNLKQWKEETIENMVGSIVSISPPIPIPKRSQFQHAARRISSQWSRDGDSRSGSWGRF